MSLGIRNKLKLISLLPIVLLFTIASYFLYTSGAKYQNIRNFSTKIEYTRVLDDLATQLAKERGMTAIYLGSGGKRVKESLRAQREMVNEKIKNYAKFISDHQIMGDRANTTKLLNLLSKKREEIDKLKLSFNDAFFGFYTPLIGSLLKEEERAMSITLSHELSNEAKLFVSFAKAKEASGIERGYMSYILTRYTKMNDRELQLWLKYIGKADNVSYDFIDDSNLKKQIDSVFRNKKAKSIFQNILKARIEILRSINDGYYTIDPTLWFNMNTEKISIVTKAQHSVFDSILHKIKSLTKQQLYIAIVSATIWFLSIVLAIVGFIVSRDITRNIKNLEAVLKNVAESSNRKLDIDLDTPEGTEKAYALLQSIVEEIKEEQKKAEEASESKSLFLANMSHEIRTPLNGIVGFTELLKNTELNDEQKEFLSIIEKSSENLLEIINNILDLSKIESNKIEIENTVFNPIDEFESAVDIYGVKAAEKKINLACFIDPRLNQPLKGDPTKIKEILINLMSNAVKFTNQGGEINVEIRRLEKSNSDKCVVSFSVEDTGIGISPDKKIHIFEAFSQADISITRKFGGTGLGLTISSRYAELMGGHLQLESELGKGTKFFFTLEFEELPKMNEDLKNHFSHVDVAFFKKEGVVKRQDHYIQEYMDYYGAKLIPFNSPEELVRLIMKKRVDVAMIDADYATDDELMKMGKVPISCNVIIKSTLQKRIEALRIHCEKILYEPINISKTIACLKEAVHHPTEKNKKQPVRLDNIGFNAVALVAEDNSINQKLIKRTLEDLGIKVILADNGLEAFEKRRHEKVDIIFMDISMPVMDGVEATKEILDYEEDEGLLHVPIVALTANALKGDRERFLSEGLDDYTTKPLVKEEIISILRKFLGDKIYQKDEKGNVLSSSRNKDHEEENNQKESTSLEEESRKTVKGDKILALKKSLLEGKIFKKIAEEMGYNVILADSEEDLFKKLDEEFGLIFVDKEIEGLDIKQIRNKIDEMAPGAALVAITDPSTSLAKEERQVCDEVVINVLNKDLLRLVIEKFINHSNKG